MKLNVKLLSPNAQLPKKALAGDAAFDLFAIADGSLNPLSTSAIPIGIATQFDENYVAIVKTRSSLGKKGISTLAGVVDSGYRGEWAVILYNSTGATFNYKVGDRIAQVVFLPVPTVDVVKVNELASSIRGESGFGGTGL